MASKAVKTIVLIKLPDWIEALAKSCLETLGIATVFLDVVPEELIDVYAIIGWETTSSELVPQLQKLDFDGFKIVLTSLRKSMLNGKIHFVHITPRGSVLREFRSIFN